MKLDFRTFLNIYNSGQWVIDTSKLPPEVLAADILVVDSNPPVSIWTQSMTKFLIDNNLSVYYEGPKNTCTFSQWSEEDLATLKRIEPVTK